MRATPLKKAAVAVAAALGLLVTAAMPASATTVGLELDSGTVTVAGNTFDVGDGPIGTPPCEIPEDTVTGTANANGTWSITGGWKAMLQLGTPPSGSWYQFDYSILAGAGTWVQTSAGPPVLSSLASTAPNHVILQVRVYELDEGCEKDVVKCIATMRMTFTGQATTASPLPTLTTGDTLVLNGSTLPPHVSTASCSAPFASFSGQTATATGLTLSVE
ncbi:MAG TPA: hypothetical protein VGO60_07675 [Iamia sp.]|jgi:hypothetical protein|nr:hypothetical protein [Iamia sp.]